MRTIRKIYWNRGLWVTLAFIVWLLEWTTSVHSENTKAISEGTFPSKIKMPIGGSANITCHVFKDENSSMIWFHEIYFDQEIRQPHKDIIIIDDKTAVLTIHNATEHKFHYICKVKQPYGQTDSFVGETYVSVGQPPTEIKDFQCKAYDFTYMTCTFTRPHNFIYTSYEVNYTDLQNKYCEKPCMDLAEHGNQFTCNLTMTNDNFYVALQDKYYFNITGKNELGIHSQIEVINHSNVVVPAKLNIELENITIDSVILTWQNFKFMYYKNITLDYEIRLQPKGLKGFFATNYDYCNDEKCRVLINNLKYAYYEYSLRVRAKVKEAPNIDSMWSEPFETKFRTSPKRPEYPPVTMPGSFYFDTELYLYWEELLEYEYSGPGFHYAISELDSNGELINLSTTKDSMAMLQWNKLEEQILRTFFIKSVNELGESINSTVLQVFADIPNRYDYQLDFVVEVYENNTYELSWKAPKNSFELSNYTIFWCNTKDTKDRCLGSIHFTMIDSDKTKFLLEPKNYSLNIAVAANYHNYSTGMIWAWCLESTSLIKLEPEATSLTGNSIKINWSLERICSAIVKGYNLTYCEINQTATLLSCITEPTTLQLKKGDLKSYTINNLKPYTTYRIHMNMYSKTKIGPMSNAIDVKTKEAAPSKPRYLSLIKLTSQSATVSWWPPEKFNGKLQFYTINVKNGEHVQRLRVNQTKDDIIAFNQTIGNLEDFTEYQIYVTAHTIAISPPSETIHFKTLIGKLNPPRMGMNIKNGKNGIFNWTEPITRSGNLEFYEVALLVKRDDNRTIKKIIPTKNNNCSFIIPECHGSDFKYSIKVRAVYAANKSEVDDIMLPPHTLGDELNDGIYADTSADSLHLECSNDQELIDWHKQLTSNTLKLSSSWQTAQESLVYNCPVKFSLFSTIAIAIIFIVIIVLAYGGCTKYKKMNNIDVVLPPGLVDHLAAYKINNNVSYGAKIDKDKDLSSSNDCLVNHKENFHLLASLSTSSNNIPNGVISTIESSHGARGFHFEDCDNAFHSREENSNGSYDGQNSSQSTDSIELNISSSGASSNNDTEQNDNKLSMETNQSKVTKLPAFNVSIPSTNNANNGYISIDKINSFPTSFLQEEESKKTVNDINPNSSNNMYVTPAQLAQIGRSERLH